MPILYSPRNSPKWYQLSVLEAVNQGLQFSVRIFLSIGGRVLGYLKNPVAVILALMIPLLVIFCHLAAMSRVAARQPEHLKEILDELSAIRIPTGKVVPNHANTKLLYVKYTTNDTWAVYLLDIASRKNSLVCEIVKGEGVSELTVRQTVTILGWSLRDEYFAYARSGRREIVICDGNSGAELGKGNLSAIVPVDNGKLKKPVSTRVKSVSTSTWLSSRALLCSEGSQIIEFSPSPKGWDRTLFFSTNILICTNGLSAFTVFTNASVLTRFKALPAPRDSAQKSSLTPVLVPPIGEIKSLAAFDLDSAVWQQSNAIYVQERAGSLKMIWETTNCTLLEFSYSQEGGKFLLHCKDDKGEFLADYFPRLSSGQDTLTNVVRLDTSEYQPVEAQLINHAEGYAYLNQSDFGESKLVIKITSSSRPVELPWKDEVEGFFINGLQLYGITASTDEPPGIWKCDLESGATNCLVSSIDQPFKYAVHASVQEGYVTNAAGERLTFYLLQPTKSNVNQKYPLVVGNMGSGEKGNIWDRWAQAVANCGAYFVCMDRRQRSPDQWADDAYCAYQFLSKNFSVDTNNVYLLGISAGAHTASSLLETRPDAWKGAFLFSMVSFPELDQIRVHSIALDVGELDIEKNKHSLLQSQDKLAAGGIRPILMIHPDTGHIVRSIRLERERMEQIAAFIRQP